MTDPSSPSPTVAYPVALLAEPKFGASALALLTGGEPAVAAPVRGFVRVRHAGREGFVPLAACTSEAATVSKPALLSISRTTALLRALTPDEALAWSPDQWFMSPDEPLIVIQQSRKTLTVQRADGQRGSIPADICGLVTSAGGRKMTRVLRQMHLVRQSTPAGQQVLVAAQDRLLLLGRQGEHVLVQRDNGQIGFIPAGVCGQVEPEAIARVGPLDVGWIVIGGIWGLFNWSALAAILVQPSTAPELRPYVGLVVVILTVVLLWLSRRRITARSFAIGILLCYGFLHVISGGVMTLWR